MPKLIILVAMVLASAIGRCQTILQLTEQIALDAQKLASIKSTLNDMIQGYDRLKTGYTQVRDIARDNFNLHRAFLDALLVVSPTVRADPRLGKIIDAVSRLISNQQGTSVQYASNPLFTPQERTYITGTLAALLDRCNQAAEELSIVVTDDQLRMSDAQRLQALDRIGADIANESAFFQRFQAELSVEGARRQREANDITTLKAFYGID